MSSMTDGYKANELRKRARELLAQADILDPPEEPENSRVVSWWQNKAEALLLRHDCQDAFGGEWRLEERK